MRTLARLFGVAAIAAIVSGPSLATETEIPLTSLQAPGKGSVLGSVTATDSTEGLLLRVTARNLVAGPNRLRLSDRPVCDYPLQQPGGDIAYRDLGLLNAGVTEDGTEAVKATLVVPGLTLAEIAGKALVIYAGGQYADTQPQFRTMPMQLACGFVPAG